MNVIGIIAPYKYEGMWVFDDPAVGLVREPFVAGIDTIIDLVVATIPQAEKGFRLIFSAMPFPGHTIKLQWRREEYGGNWYYAPQFDIDAPPCSSISTAPRPSSTRKQRRSSGEASLVPEHRPLLLKRLTLPATTFDAAASEIVAETAGS